VLENYDVTPTFCNSKHANHLGSFWLKNMTPIIPFSMCGTYSQTHTILPNSEAENFTK
jgi:hypothetical protein